MGRLGEPDDIAWAADGNSELCCKMVIGPWLVLALDVQPALGLQYTFVRGSPLNLLSARLRGQVGAERSRVMIRACGIGWTWIVEVPGEDV